MPHAVLYPKETSVGSNMFCHQHHTVSKNLNATTEHPPTPTSPRQAIKNKTQRMSWVNGLCARPGLLGSQAGLGIIALQYEVFPRL